MVSQPIGLSLANPLNIERGEPWRGLHPEQTHRRFARFVCPLYSLRAGAIILRHYRERIGIATLGGVTARWAPAGENAPAAYAATLARLTGWHPDQEIDLRRPETLERLLPALVTVESGRDPYLACQYEDAVRLSFSPPSSALPAHLEHG